MRRVLRKSLPSVGASRIIGASVFDSTPANVRELKWSEDGVAVTPVQLIVALTVELGEVRVTGLSAVTRYLTTAEHGRHTLVLEAELSSCIDLDPIMLIADRSSSKNAYEPSDDRLRVLLELAGIDALGLLAGLPASAFLGGLCRTQLPAYASLPSFREPSDAIACARAAVSDGFKAIKFHASGDVSADLETIAMARAEFAGEVELIWDASCAYDYYGALTVGKMLSQADFLWFEAPLRDDAGLVLSQLAQRTAIPLIPDASSSLRSIGDWGRDAVSGVWGGLRIDVTRARSVSDAMRVVHLAETLGLPCEIQSFGYPMTQYMNLGLMATTHSCRFFESPYPVTDLEDGLVEAPRVVEGFVDVPLRSGFGHPLDLDALTTRSVLVAEAGDV